MNLKSVKKCDLHMKNIWKLIPVWPYISFAFGWVCSCAAVYTFFALLLLLLLFRLRAPVWTLSVGMHVHCTCTWSIWTANLIKFMPIGSCSSQKFSTSLCACLLVWLLMAFSRFLAAICWIFRLRYPISCVQSQMRKFKFAIFVVSKQTK